MAIYSALNVRNETLRRSLEMEGTQLSKFDCRHVFKCMDVSGCKAEFTTEETRRFVNEKTLALRDKLESGDAIREVCSVVLLTQASIEGFVTCPFCDYGAIVEDDGDKEFRCQNEDCKTVSCRSCRKESHIPFSCEGIHSCMLT